MKRDFCTLLVLLVLSLAIVSFSNPSSANYFPDPGPALPRIYIRSDGTVEPATAPIEHTGDVYKLTGDIVLYTVEIQRDNIVLDGAGYTIRGNASWMGYDAGNNGVIVSGRKNVNVTGLNFEGCYTCVRVLSSSGINVVGNSFSDSNFKGIVIQGSSFCIVADNTFTGLHTDLNVLTINVNGTNNAIRNNTLTRTTYGIQVIGSSNVVSGNKIEAVLSIKLDRAQSNIITDNKITGPEGRNGQEGVSLFANCSGNLIFNNSITGFINNAVRFVFNAENNTVYGNYFADNKFAVVIQGRAVNNKFYGNTITADSCNVSVFEVQSTFWDNGTIGNYWGNYQGEDSNGDGIGNTPYVVNGYLWDQKAGGFVAAPAGQDNYPLMAPYNFGKDEVTLPQSLPLIVIFVIVAAVIALTFLLVYFKKCKRK